MAVTIYHCPDCARDVHLPSDDPPYCPVCSRALMQAAVTEEVTLVSTVSPVGPEIYLG